MKSLPDVTTRPARTADGNYIDDLPPSFLAITMPEEAIGRWLLTEDGVVPGYITVDGERLIEVCREPPPRGSRRSFILPAFVNAHTHLGDSIGYRAPPGSVQETVGPGGYKARLLANASPQEKVEAMRHSLEMMSRGGTASFIDYREEGVEGVRSIRQALGSTPLRGIVLGRPASTDATTDQVEAVLEESDGLAFSSVSDWPEELLREASDLCRRQGKVFSLHASEVVREDIDLILDLGPDFLVHMTAATDDDLTRCADSAVPLVVCPRSNDFFGIDLDIPKLLRMGMTVALGTDNAMISEPSMLAEVQAAYSTGARPGGMSPADALHLATTSGRKVLNAKGKITTESGASDDLVVMDVQGEEPLLELVSSARDADVVAVIQAGRVRRLSFGGHQ